MPSFYTLPEQDKDAIIAFLFNQEDKRRYQVMKQDSKSTTINKETRKRYNLKDYIHLEDQNGYPGSETSLGHIECC